MGEELVLSSSSERKYVENILETDSKCKCCDTGERKQKDDWHKYIQKIYTI